MMCMTPAASTSAPIRRLVLVPAGARTDSAVRRFRLARLRLEDREVARAERFAHLKAAHD
jgi:hypothetical protein